MSRSHERDQLEMKALTEPGNIDVMCRLADIYIAENRLNKAKKQVEMALGSFRPSLASTEIGLQVLDMAVNYWKADRFVSKGSLRLNYAIKRRDFLSTILAFALRLQAQVIPKFAQVVSLKLAYFKECLGSYQDALTILSDLITQQATNGVDLSFIIFKAAILLRHKGNAKQAIEYLEFLQEDPPLHDGYTKLHIMAYLVSTYELSGDKYKFFLNKAYRDLAAACTEELTAATTTSTTTTSTAPEKGKNHLKRMEAMLRSSSAMTASEFWEVMALQALERCEYVLTAEFLTLASRKAPGKGSLMHSLAEVLMLLNEQEAAEKVAERALELLPQSSELRNLLLQINPEKWTDRIRFLGTTTKAAAGGGSGDVGEASSAVQQQQQERDINDPKASKLAKNLRSTATNAMEVVQKVTAANNTSTSTSNAINVHKKKGGTVIAARRPASPIPQAIPIITQQSSSHEAVAVDTLKILPSSPPRGGDILLLQQQHQIEEEQQTQPRQRRAGKPIKPAALDEEELRYLQLALSGNSSIHYYDPILEAMAAIRRNTERERKAAMRDKLLARELNNSSNSNSNSK